MSIALADVLGTRVKVKTPKVGFSESEPGASSGRRRIRDSEIAQSLKRVLRPSTIRRRLNRIEDAKKNEIEVSVNRAEASAAAFQANLTEDKNEQLLLLLTAAKLYEKALEGVERLKHNQKSKAGMANYLNRALQGVRNDLANLESSILKEDIEALRIKVNDLKLTFISPDTETKLQELEREHQIDSMTYKVIGWSCAVAATVVTAVSVSFPPVQNILLPIAGAIAALGGRMRWKAKSERTKMITVKQLIRDRADATRVTEIKQRDSAPRDFDAASEELELAA